MKKLICILSFVFITFCVQAQNNVFMYNTKNRIIILTLKENNFFLYNEIFWLGRRNFIEEPTSGKWEQNGQNIILKTSETLKPKVKIKKTFLKKDTLTIFFKKTENCVLLKNSLNIDSFNHNNEEYSYERDLHFYDKNDKEIFINGLPNGRKIEIPMNNKIARIDFYFPYKRNPNSAKLSVKVSENSGQILISNLSRYLQKNFDDYTFVLKKKYILMSSSLIEKVKLKRNK